MDFKKINMSNTVFIHSIFSINYLKNIDNKNEKISNELDIIFKTK